MSDTIPGIQFADIDDLFADKLQQLGVTYTATVKELAHALAEKSLDMLTNPDQHKRVVAKRTVRHITTALSTIANIATAELTSITSEVIRSAISMGIDAVFNEISLDLENPAQ